MWGDWSTLARDTTPTHTKMATVPHRCLITGEKYSECDDALVDVVTVVRVSHKNNVANNELHHSYFARKAKVQERCLNGEEDRPKGRNIKAMKKAVPNRMENYYRFEYMWMDDTYSLQYQVRKTEEFNNRLKRKYGDGVPRIRIVESDSE